MRENIEKLMNSGITAHAVAVDTRIARNTVYRLFNGESSLDNITLKNAEILSAYWEEIKMKTLVDEKNITNKEGVAYWSIGLHESPDTTATNNLGAENAWIYKVEVDNDGEEKTYYAVAVETAYGVTNWNKGEESVLNDLVFNATYSGEHEFKAFFETEAEAYEYAEKHYPEIDLAQAIKERYEK